MALKLNHIKLIKVPLNINHMLTTNRHFEYRLVDLKDYQVTYTLGRWGKLEEYVTPINVRAIQVVLKILNFFHKDYKEPESSCSVIIPTPNVGTASQYTRLVE